MYVRTYEMLADSQTYSIGIQNFIEIDSAISEEFCSPRLEAVYW